MITDSDRDREFVEGFLEFVEDSASPDDRYGTATRRNSDDGAVASSHFHIGGPCWLEVTADSNKKQVRVGFIADDREVISGIDELLSESGQSLSQFVGAGFEEAGLRWSEPMVDRFETSDRFGFTTSIALEEFSDLESDNLRDKTLRMLEGFLIAFGPAAVSDEAPGNDDWDEDDDD
ncbi:MAG: hypothetical protein AABZ47_04065 [Planctomycetota bacterium]